MVFNEFDKLQDIIVGSELNLNNYRIAKITYTEYNWGAKDFYYNCFKERIKQFNNLENILKQNNINVTRLKSPDKIYYIEHNNKKYSVGGCGNPRDLALIYYNKIIMTPCKPTRRGEQLLLLNHLQNNYGSKYDIIDLGCDENYLDAACFLKIGKNCIVNINSDEKIESLKKIKKILNNINFIPVNICHSHIDGSLTQLNDDIFLTNKDLNIDFLKKYKILKVNTNFNIVSLNRKKIITSKNDILKNYLENEGFEVLEIDFDYSTFFGGGIHCSTLDINRGN